MAYLNQADMFFLIFVRITSFFVTAPFFGIRGVPVMVKVALGLLVSIFLLPVIPLTYPANDLWAYITAAVNEAFAGLLLGYMTSLVFSAIQFAGQVLDLHMGMAMSTIFDPQYAIDTTIVGQFFTIFGMLLFLQLNGHHALLLALKESFLYLPLGGLAFDGGVAWAVVKLFAGMLSLALRIASPIIVVLVLSDLVLSLISRTVPQLNVFILGFPLKAGLGMLTLIMILPLLATALGNIFSHFERDLVVLIRSWPN